MSEFRFRRALALTLLAGVSISTLVEVWRHTPAMLPNDSGQPHVPAEGPSPSGAPIGVTSASASASATFNVMASAAGYNGFLWLGWPDRGDAH
jgi:hypothetical protein